MKVYRSPHPWSPARPETLVVCCSDGRYHQHVQDFVRTQVSERPDLFVVPGGPAAVDPWASSFDHARVFEASLRFFLSKHEIQSIWLIAHQGCAFYAARYGESSVEAMHPRQMEDLLRARVRILEIAPALEVRLLYAAIEAERVVFSRVGDRPAKIDSPQPGALTRPTVGA